MYITLQLEQTTIRFHIVSERLHMSQVRGFSTEKSGVRWSDRFSDGGPETAIFKSVSFVCGTRWELPTTLRLEVLICPIYNQ